ncbi:MAG: glycine betaine dehydrogenase BetB [Phormidesmis priestleyi Ana]|uniref:Glycine betaine dehydrogenase BetB n=1 Tax=Phormidesmis priestleyi Ana TaxID=1666911 RepID=A0A0P8BRN0_9CYAN|nr:MAG: glycine betaine dehydrogenase BetB [Phormidesmis priestleyi Ana]
MQVKTADADLNRISLDRVLYVGGEYRAGAGQSFAIVNPATEAVIGYGASATDEEVDEAIAIANQVQKGWQQLSALARAEALHEVATELGRMKPQLAKLMTQEMGKPYKESADEVEWCVSALRYYAEVARHEGGKVLGPAVEGQLHYVVKEPLGVVVSILPFNYPLVLFVWQAAAALAAGNAVIVKPSLLTTKTTLLGMEAFSTLAPGLVQCLPGDGSVGARLTASPDTHFVAFTGGVERGQAVARACAEQFKPILLETSGNDAFIVMPSAPMAVAVRGALFGAFLNCGQVCTSSERFYVHADVYDAFAEQLVAQARTLRIGNGLDTVDIGPMASEAGRDRFEKILARAVEQGATVACGGQRPADHSKGWFFEPTVLTNVSADLDILKDEVFGPVASLVKVESFEEAIEEANRSHFGLGATIYTQDLAEAMRATRELAVGMVWVNAPLLDNDAGPFGGKKMSGMGRELGAEGLDTFRHTKLVMIDPEAAPQDFWWFPYADAEQYGGEVADSNGHSNGHANGHANGHSNG